MIYKVFSVLDTAVKAYLPPIYLRSRGEATRMVTESLRDEKHQFAKHSSDYALYELGEWNDETGLYNTHEAPVLIGSVSEFKQD
jgi:hypothetical protein